MFKDDVDEFVVRPEDFLRNSMISACEVVDEIVSRGGHKIYIEKVINPKLRPHSIKFIKRNERETCHFRNLPADVGEIRKDLGH